MPLRIEPTILRQRQVQRDVLLVGRAKMNAVKTPAEALHQLKMARELAVWFQRSFGNNRKFDPGLRAARQTP
jgi:type I restriction enzyme R subunit